MKMIKENIITVKLNNEVFQHYYLSKNNIMKCSAMLINVIDNLYIRGCESHIFFKTIFYNF